MPKVVRRGKKQNMNGERWLLQLGHGPWGSLCYSQLANLKQKLRTSLMAQMVKSLLVMQETWVRSLGQEDPLEKRMATHSSILARRN